MQKITIPLPQLKKNASGHASTWSALIPNISKILSKVLYL